METSDQIAKFEEFWQQFSVQLEAGDGVGGYRPERRRLCSTIVARLPGAIGDQIAAAVGELRDRFPDHYYYPRHTLHFTLLDVTALFDDAPDRATTPPLAERMLARLGELLRDEEPLALRMRGLGVFPTTVFAELIDDAGRVTALREHVIDAARDVAGIDVPAPVAPGLVFANAVRFDAPPEPGLVSEVRRHRAALDLPFEVAAFDVVSTDKALSDEATIVHRGVSLGGRERAASPANLPE